MVIWADPAKVRFEGDSRFYCVRLQIYAQKSGPGYQWIERISWKNTEIGRKAPEIDDENAGNFRVFIPDSHEIKSEKVYVIRDHSWQTDFTSTHVYRVQRTLMDLPAKR